MPSSAAFMCVVQPRKDPSKVRLEICALTDRSGVRSLTCWNTPGRSRWKIGFVCLCLRRGSARGLRPRAGFCAVVQTEEQTLSAMPSSPAGGPSTHATTHPVQQELGPWRGVICSLIDVSTSCYVYSVYSI